MRVLRNPPSTVSFGEIRPSQAQQRHEGRVWSGPASRRNRRDGLSRRVFQVRYWLVQALLAAGAVWGEGRRGWTAVRHIGTLPASRRICCRHDGVVTAASNGTFAQGGTA